MRLRFIKTLFICFSMVSVAQADPIYPSPYTNVYAQTYHNDVDSIVVERPIVKKTLSLEDAIFLALRYNTAITNQELGRIVQKFNLRVAENAFELHYALTGAMSSSRTVSNGNLGHSQSYDVVPAFSLNTPFGTNITLTQNNVNQSSGNKVFYNPGVTLEIKQPLIQGASPSVVMAPLFNAYDQETQNRLALRAGVISQVVAVINQYRVVIGLEQNLKIQYESLKRAEDNLEVTKKLIAAGKKAQMDLAQAEQSVAQSRFSIIQAKNSLAQGMQTLLTVIGLDPNSYITVPAVIPTPHVKIPDVNKSIIIALSNDPTYQSDLLNLKILRRQLVVARDAEKWQLNADAVARWGFGSGPFPNDNWTSVVNGFNNSQRFGLQLVIPLNNLSVEQGIVSAQVSLQQMEAQVQFDRSQVITNVTNNIRTIKADTASLEQAQLALKLQQQNLNNTYLQFKYGQASQFDVTLQQGNLTSAEQTVLTNQIALLNDFTAYGQILQITLDEWNIKLRY